MLKSDKSQRVYIHKPWICACEPNHAEGDEPEDNHKDPRNEWTDFSHADMPICDYCHEKLVQNPRAGEVEKIKTRGKGSWQDG